MKWAILLKRSTMVRMTIILSKAGSPVKKSMEIWDRGGVDTGKGWRGPAGGWLDDLFWLQVRQAWMYSWASLSMEDHQKR